jgi:hypothetical protein
MENMVHIQAHEQPKIVVHERAGGVQDCLLCGMMSLVYPTKADTKRVGWRRLGRELWDLIRQLPGCRNGFNGQDNWIVRPIFWRCFDSC